MRNKSILTFIIIALVSSLQSCTKKNIIKSISGTWTLESYTENGIDYFSSETLTLDGVFNFSETTPKENKKGKGICNYTLTFNFFEEIEIQEKTSTYKILDKGETIHIFDQFYRLDYSVNRMVLTTNDDPNLVYKWTFVR